MKTGSVYLKAAAAALALAALGTTQVAQARDNVYWSVGVEAAPGVTVGLGNHRPVYVQPAPVYVAPQPIYVQPRVVYSQPYYVQAAPVYGAGYYYDAPRRGHWKHKHKHHRHHRDHD